MSTNSLTPEKILSYCTMLGVPIHASRDEVARAYRVKAQKVHPDRNPTAEAHEEFLTLQEAFTVLSDPVADNYKRVLSRPVVSKEPLDIAREILRQRIDLYVNMPIAVTPMPVRGKDRQVNALGTYVAGDEFPDTLQAHGSEIPDAAIVEMVEHGAWEIAYTYSKLIGLNPYKVQDIQKTVEVVFALVSAAINNAARKSKKDYREIGLDLLLTKKFSDLIDKGAVAAWGAKYQESRVRPFRVRHGVWVGGRLIRL